MTCLQHVERPTHVALAESDERVGCLGQYLNILLLNNLVHQYPNVLLLQRAEAETSTTRQQGGTELVGVVGDDAEPGIGRIFLHDATQSHLGRVGHGISLVEDNQLEAAYPGTGSGAAEAKYLFGRRKCLDLLAHHVDATVV